MYDNEFIYTEDDNFGKAEAVTSDDASVYAQVVDMSMLRPIHNDIELNNMIELYNTSDDENEKNIILNSIVAHFHGRVKKYSGKFAKFNPDFYDDLVQEGNSAVKGAVLKYDATKGARFSTFVFPRINADIQRFYRQHGRQVAVPVNKYTDCYKVNSVVSDYYKTYGEYPSDEYVADKLGVTVKEIRDTLCSFSSETSLDKTIDEENELALIDCIADDTEWSEMKQKEILKALLESFEDKDEKRVFMLGIGCDENGEQINEALGTNISAYVRALGCSRSYVQKLLKNTQNHVRTIYGEYAA